MNVDSIQAVVAARAKAFGITAYAISKACDGSPTPESVKRYIEGRNGLNTKHVSRICEVLDLELKPKPKSRSTR